MPLPEVTASATPSEIEPGASVDISASSNNQNVTYQWSPANVVADPNAAATTATVQQDTWLFVTVTTAEGCSSVDSVLIDVVITECNEENVFIPNTFTPNGDGKNDVFRVRSIIPLESMTLIIYNRWGEKIFESNNQNAGWDGTFNGELAASDAYGFYFSGKCGDNIFERKGKITLLR